MATGIEILQQQLMRQALNKQYGTSNLIKAQPPLVGLGSVIGGTNDNDIFDVQGSDVMREANGVIQRILSGDERTQRWLMMDTGSDYEREVRAHARGLMQSRGMTPTAPILNANDPRALGAGGADIDLSTGMQTNNPSPPPPPPKPSDLGGAGMDDQGERDLMDLIGDAATWIGRGGKTAEQKAAERAAPKSPAAPIPKPQPKGTSIYIPPPLDDIRDVGFPPGFAGTHADGDHPPTTSAVNPPDEQMGPPQPLSTAEVAKMAKSKGIGMDDLWLPLAQMGFAMGASDSPRFAQALSQGGLAGLSMLTSQQKQKAESAFKQRALDIEQQKADTGNKALEVERAKAGKMTDKTKQVLELMQLSAAMGKPMNLEDSIRAVGYDNESDLLKIVKGSLQQMIALGGKGSVTDEQVKNVADSVLRTKAAEDSAAGKKTKTPNVGEVQRHKIVPSGPGKYTIER